MYEPNESLRSMSILYVDKNSNDFYYISPGAAVDRGRIMEETWAYLINIHNKRISCFPSYTTASADALERAIGITITDNCITDADIMIINLLEDRKC